MSIVYRTLGKITVVTSGESEAGHKKELALDIVAACDNESFEWDTDGVMDAGHGWIEGRFEPASWYEGPTDEEPYRDEALADAVEGAVHSLGHTGWVSWSESGLQDEGIAHFDMDIKLIEQIWPEYKLEALRGPKVGR